MKKFRILWIKLKWVLFGDKKIKQVNNEIKKVHTRGLKIINSKKIKKHKSFASTKGYKI